MARPRLKPVVRAQGADIEIVERSPGSELAIIPNTVRINGTEVHIPADSAIDISEISSDAVVTVTLTMFVRTLSIRHEPAELPQT
ncbi:hypothetical protein ACIGFK_13275 [Streptomyces sp. NPDC085524]|uniref:hypothetical protein n=1 Tax=Streptomyces sp. NPDC085524 TaxID=3365728 RepID=UPI0037D07A62